MMHKNDQGLRTFFGKGYFWTESPRGNLKLMSVERLRPMMDKVNEAIAHQRELTLDV